VSFIPCGALSGEELAAENIDGFRWWRLREIGCYRGPDLFSPRDLATPLAGLMNHLRTGGGGSPASACEDRAGFPCDRTLCERPGEQHSSEIAPRAATPENPRQRWGIHLVRNKSGPGFT
jgi:hypothetical protein